MNIFSEFDQFCMQKALQEAKTAFQEDEVPIGAVLVHEGKILVSGHNEVEKNKDATCHAEMVVIRKASKILEDFRLINTTLYVTVEPCLMCLGGLILSRVGEVVWGCPDLRHGADGSFCQIPIERHPIHRIRTRSGLFAQESKELLQTFFQEKRERKRNLNAL